MTGILEVLDWHSDRLDLLCLKARREIQKAVKARQETIIQVPDQTTLAVFSIALEAEGFQTMTMNVWLVQAERPELWKRTIWVVTPGAKSGPPHVVWTEADAKL